MANEFNFTPESGATGKEFYFPDEEAKRFDEFEHPADVAVPRKKASSKIRKMVYLLAACGSVASFGFAMFVTSPDSSQNPPTETSTEDSNPAAGTLDIAFPVLSNLEKNGETDSKYGVLNEDYIRIIQNGTYSVWENSTRTDIYLDKFEDSSSVYYDEAVNTLYLNGADTGRIQANLMGNSFTVNVTGDCYLDSLESFGYHYGGSVKITGSGALYIGYKNTRDYGILISGEKSESCLMIDSDVTLKVKGSKAAVMITETSMEQAVYCLSNMDPGFTRGTTQKRGRYYSYTVFDTSGKPAKEVTFSKQNTME